MCTGLACWLVFGHGVLLMLFLTVSVFLTCIGGSGAEKQNHCYCGARDLHLCYLKYGCVHSLAIRESTICLEQHTFFTPQGLNRLAPRDYFIYSEEWKHSTQSKYIHYSEK